MKNIFKYSLLGLAAVTLAGCDDYLDSEPITNVSTETFLYSENDLGAYAANMYGLLPSHGSGYNVGLFANDNGTDNQTGAQPST